MPVRTEREGAGVQSRPVLLERDSDCDPDAGVIAVVQVVPIVGVIKIYIVGLVPVCRPRVRPRINECDPIAVSGQLGGD